MRGEKKEEQRSRKGGGDRRGGYVAILDWSKGHRKKKRGTLGVHFMVQMTVQVART